MEPRDVTEYLEPTSLIDSDCRAIRNKAAEIVGSCSAHGEKAKRLFYFVRDTIKYYPYTEKYLPEHYRASVTLKRGHGYCVQKAVLLAALARAAGIPTRLRFDDIRNHQSFGGLAKLLGSDMLLYHGYDEFYLEGQWLRADASLDLDTCRKNRITPVEFDASGDATFASHNLDGHLHFEHVSDHGYYHDVPFESIMTAFNLGYGDERADLFKRVPGKKSGEITPGSAGIARDKFRSL